MPINPICTASSTKHAKSAWSHRKNNAALYKLYSILCRVGHFATLNFKGEVALGNIQYLWILNLKFKTNQTKTEAIRALPCLNGEPPNVVDRLFLADVFCFWLCGTSFDNLLRTEKCQFASLVMWKFSIFSYWDLMSFK